MKQYTPETFFKLTPNTQLVKYFIFKSIPFDLTEVGEYDSNAFMELFLTLSNHNRETIESDFNDIHALASDQGIKALITEANEHDDTECREVIAKLEGLHNKALWAFINKGIYWKAASLYSYLDTIYFSSSSWKKRKNFSTHTFISNEINIKKLSNSIGDYFYQKEAKGKNCKIEYYHWEGKHYFFAYPEDYVKKELEWSGAELKSRSYHPAIEVIFVYDKELKELDIYAPKNIRKVYEFQKRFAKYLLGIDELKKERIEKKIYDLDLFNNAGFVFSYPDNSPIESIVITSMRLSLKNTHPAQEITLNCTHGKTNTIKELRNTLYIPDSFISQIKFNVLFQKINDQEGKPKRFTISYPNNCNLSLKGEDWHIRQLLIKSGLEV